MKANFTFINVTCFEPLEQAALVDVLGGASAQADGVEETFGLGVTVTDTAEDLVIWNGSGALNG